METRPRLHQTRRDIEVVSPAAFLRLGEGGPRGFWASGDRWLAHVGALHELAEGGGDRSAPGTDCDGQCRFGSVRDRAARLFAQVRGEGCARIFGGFAFAPGPAGGPPWSHFPSARLQLPEVELEHDRRAGTCRLLVRGRNREEARRSRIRWEEALTRAAGDTRREPPHRRSRETPRGPKVPTPGRKAWIRSVRRILAGIATGQVRKVVLARTLDVTPSRPVPPLDLLLALWREGEGSHVFLFEPVAGEAVVGAAPETIAAVADGVVRATAVAGSAGTGANPVQGEELARRLANSGKDRAEHDFVVTDMVARLAALGCRVRQDPEPRVLTLSRIQHLVTGIDAVLPPGIALLDILASLHPTPAVCGEPRERALSILTESEAFDRGWYAGPVGWLGSDGEGVFVPALRSAVSRGRAGASSRARESCRGRIRSWNGRRRSSSSVPCFGRWRGRRAPPTGSSVRRDRAVTGGELNLAWARAVFATLVEYGMDEVQITPGSRSTPLVLAAQMVPGLRIRVHLDERCAAFFALGYGRTHLGPAAIVTTSGTAVANLLPAVVEADQSDVPLIVASADRPPALRGADANQTIVQPGIFGERVRFEADLPLPSLQELRNSGPLSIAEIVRRAARHAVGPPSGPVHLNIPFEKPLHPESPEGLELRDPADVPATDLASEADAIERGGDTPRTWRRRPRGRGRGRDRTTLVAHRLSTSRRPLLVAGPASDPGLDGPAVVRFARRRATPALADPLSGARFHRGAPEGRTTPLLGAYDHFLRVPEVIERLCPDLIIRVGRTPTSGALERALATWRRSTQVVIDDGAHRKDHQGLASHYLHASAGAVLERLAGDGRSGDGHGSPPSSPSARRRWIKDWMEIEAAAWAAVSKDASDAEHEGAYAAATLRALPPGATLFVSSSMPVRDVDAYARPAPLGVQVLGNRGASGIDGIVSTVMGCAGGGAGPVVGLVGDIAFYHDMNGLLAARDGQLNVVFVLVDNDGGGIFHMLPIRHFEPVFTPCFATPHGLDFRHAARLYGLRFTNVSTPAELEEAVAAGVRRAGTEVVRVRTSRERNRLSHERTRARVARRVHEILQREER